MEGFKLQVSGFPFPVARWEKRKQKPETLFSENEQQNFIHKTEPIKKQAALGGAPALPGCF
jgi:hypothetical protein